MKPYNYDRLKEKILSLPYDYVTLLRPLNLACEAECNAHFHSGGEYSTTVKLNGDVLIIVVSDNGKGIDDIDRAFEERFSTAGEEAKKHGVGGGLGMPKLKEADWLDVKTEKNIGTVITMGFNLAAGYDLGAEKYKKTLVR